MSATYFFQRVRIGALISPVAGAPELPAYDTAEDFKAAQPNKTADGHAADGDAAAASGSCGKKEDGCAGACAGQSGSGGGCA